MDTNLQTTKDLKILHESAVRSADKYLQHKTVIICRYQCRGNPWVGAKPELGSFGKIWLNPWSK